MILEWVILSSFLFYYLICYSLWAVYYYKKTEKAILAERESRLKLYQETLLSSWIPAIIIMVMIAIDIFTLEDLGLNALNLNPLRWFSIPGTVLGFLGIAFFTYQTIALRMVVRKGNRVSFVLTDSLKALLPETAFEKKVWVLVSLTAGITEELLFRGYLMHGLKDLLGLDWFWVLILSSIVFGLVHLYLGWQHIIKTAAVGLLFGLLYMASGSIFSGMVLHIMMDLSSVDLRSVQDKPQPVR